MNKLHVRGLPLLVILVVALIFGFLIYKNYAVQTAAPTQIDENTTIKVFLIALEDDGKSGKLIGCNDSAIPVERQISKTQKNIKGALSELLAIKDKYYGESGLYNSLSNADLKVDSVDLENGNATIRLSGSYEFTGVCEDARFMAQIEETAREFLEVHEAEIFLNGRSLKDLYK